MSQSVRVRFAPSPTGHLHVGGARTALFNWLYARHHGGMFILRIEDTDRSRSTDDNIDDIVAALRWLGLDWDEGPPSPGYRQTERFDLYREHARRLVAAGRAYYCACTPEQLEAERAEAQAKNETFRYSGRCRALGLTAGALRLRIPEEGTTVVDDLIHGPVTFDHRHLDDWILLRSDGTPTYNFCVVVDDVTMRISHVIRGNDHLSNTPKQVLCYEALGYPVPAFAHVSMILGPDRARLSKRHGATSVQAYREQGILPEAMVNYLARLGWSSGDQERRAGGRGAARRADRAAGGGGAVHAGVARGAVPRARGGDGAEARRPRAAHATGRDRTHGVAAPVRRARAARTRGDAGATARRPRRGGEGGPVRLLLARHGESVWNAERRFQGRTDVALSERGRAQAAALGRALRGYRVAAAYVSPFRRARETAEVALAGTGLPLVALDELRELSLGEWEGCTVDEVRGREGDPYRAWLLAPHDCPPPGGEPLDAVSSRVRAAMDHIGALHPNGEDVLVVAHGGVISVYACALLGCSFNSLWRLRVDNASLTVVRPPRLVSLNDTAHLPGALAPAPHVRASLAAGAPAAAGPAPAPSDELAP